MMDSYGKTIYPTLVEMTAARVTTSPDVVALVCEGRKTTFAELETRTNRIGNALIAAGATPHSIVAILSRNSDLHVEVLLGSVKIAAIVLAFNWRLAVPELIEVARDAAPKILFFEDEFRTQAEALAALSPDLSLIRLGSAASPAAEYSAFVASGAAGSPKISVAPETVALLLYTSGTTGRPKGVPSTHFAILHGQTQIIAAGPRGALSADEISLLSTPLFHLAALGVLFSSLIFGSTLVILPNPQLPALIEAVEKYRVTRAVFLPAVMPALLEAAATGIDVSSLRTILYGASAIPEALLARMIKTFDCGFLQNYGMTEASSSVTFLGPEDHFVGSSKLASCGRAYPDTRIRIVISDGRDAAAGEAGEIMIHVPSMMSGYWNQPDETGEVLSDGWYASGDIGYLDEEGYLFLCDRKKDMIVSGGENIYSTEVESALSAHPEVERATVIGVPSETWGEEVKALVILRSGATLSAEDLAYFVRTRIAGYKVPKSIDFVDELPLTSVGKVAKAELRARYWQGLDRSVN